MKISSRTWFFFLFMAVLLALLLLEVRQPALHRLGQPAPAFTLERLGGGKLSSKDLPGRVVLVDFWATWCPPCVDEMPFLARIAKEYENRGRKSVV